MNWRRRADSNRRIEVLQTSALTAWLRRPDFRDPGLIVLVPRAGFEPTQANAHGPLKTACLPIPPPRPISEKRIIPRVTLRHTGKPPTAGPFHSPSPVGRGLRLGTTLPAMVVAAASQFTGERPHPNPLPEGEGHLSENEKALTSPPGAFHPRLGPTPSFRP